MQASERESMAGLRRRRSNGERCGGATEDLAAEDRGGGRWRWNGERRRGNASTHFSVPL